MHATLPYDGSAAAVDGRWLEVMMAGGLMARWLNGIFDGNPAVN